MNFFTESILQEGNPDKLQMPWNKVIEDHITVVEILKASERSINITNTDINTTEQITALEFKYGLEFVSFCKQIVIENLYNTPNGNLLYSFNNDKLSKDFIAKLFIVHAISTADYDGEIFYQGADILAEATFGLDFEQLKVRPHIKYFGNIIYGLKDICTMMELTPREIAIQKRRFSLVAYGISLYYSSNLTNLTS